MQALQLKLQYLQNELQYIEHMLPSYDKKFTDKLHDLGKTHLIPTMPVCKESESDTKNHSGNIKDIYRKLMIKYHPDKSTDPKCDEISKFINDCYSKNDEESLVILDETDEYSKEIPEYLLKIKETREKIDTYKNRTSYLWNTSCGLKNYIENLFCTKEDFDKYENEMKEKLIKQKEDLKKENEKLREVISFVKNIDVELENSSKKFVIEYINYYREKCSEEYANMTEMKIKAKSDIPYLSYEKELDEINKSELESMSLSDLENYKIILKKIFEYFRDMYWKYSSSRYK